MATDFRAKQPKTPRKGRATDPDAVRTAVEQAAEKVNEKLAKEVAKQVAKQADKVAVTATKHIERLDRLADHLESVDVWTRGSFAQRRPKLSRDEIAAAAIHIADAEGLDALSMRRLAAELDVGTMSIYHYVRTKDELLTLVFDAFMGEVVVPERARIPKDWRSAITLIAQRTREAIERHPWVLDISDDPPIGPNSIRHFDQTQQAISSLEAPLTVRFDLMTTVDEFVFGYCHHARNNLRDDEATSSSVLEYMQGLLDGGEYPTISSLVAEHGFEPLWDRIHQQMRDPKRFDRNLSRLLDGFAQNIAKP